MRIFYISSANIPSVYADSVGVMSLCESFAKAGYEITLVVRNRFWGSTPKGYNGDDWEFYGVDHNFKIHKIPALPRFTWWFEHSSIGYVKGEECLVFTRSSPVITLALASGHYALLDCHRAPIGDDEKIIKQHLRSPRFLGVSVITKALRQHYVEKIPSLADKIIVAPNGVRYSDYASAAPSRETNEAGLVAGYVGSFHRSKGVQVIIELAKLCPDVTFKIYGGSKKELESRFGINNISANIRVLGFVPQSQVPQCMASFDVALLPNQEKVLLRTEELWRWTSPIKMFEYMASGCAIIASDLPVLREVLKDGHNALLVPPTDCDAWRKAVKLLQSDPGLRKRLGEQAQKEACQKYSWEAKAQRIIRGLNLESIDSIKR
jgi:glycosyltransferase involved in cell wall biosynthesis